MVIRFLYIYLDLNMYSVVKETIELFKKTKMTSVVMC